MYSYIDVLVWFSIFFPKLVTVLDLCRQGESILMLGPDEHKIRTSIVLSP